MDNSIDKYLSDLLRTILYGDEYYHAAASSIRSEHKIVFNTEPLLRPDETAIISLVCPRCQCPFNFCLADMWGFVIPAYSHSCLNCKFDITVTQDN